VVAAQGTAPPPAGMSEAQRADLWIGQLERERAATLRSTRWGGAIVAGLVGATGAGFAAFGHDIPHAARWAMGSAAAPGALGILLACVLPEEQAGAWALTGFGLASATVSASLAYPWLMSPDHDERHAGMFLAAGLAVQALLIVPVAFLDRGPPTRAFSDYRR
jgi:hypothetical protein